MRTERTTSRTLLRGGRLVAGGGLIPGDVLIEGERIAAVGEEVDAAGAEIIDVEGRLLVPGFVDAHSHADGRIFDERTQQAYLRQGVTTVIGGQDGVSYAPGDGSYGTEYFRAIDGAHPTFRGGSVATLLATYDGTVPLNMAYLAPAGTIRHEVIGTADRAPKADELARMRELVRAAMDDGAVGLSTGLDYVPGIFASAQEIGELCLPVAEAGGVYVTHMRGGYEDNSEAGIDEVRRIAVQSGVAVHVSHFHARARIVRAQLAALADAGVRATFDAYPYTRGNSLLMMPTLPPELVALDPEELSARLALPETRERLHRDWEPRIEQNASLGPEWPELLTLSHAAAPELAWMHGLTLAEIAARQGIHPLDVACDIIQATRGDAAIIMAVRHRREDAEFIGQFTAPGFMVGSDGIYVGAHPHPRGFGAFATMLARFTRDLGAWDWGGAVERLSTRAVRTFGLGDRGSLSAGAIADIAVLDVDGLAAPATYEHPDVLARGIDDVFVAGVPVLAGGALTGRTPGRGLRRAKS